MQLLANFLHSEASRIANTETSKTGSDRYTVLLEKT